MADEMDYRIRMDIALPPEAFDYADQIRDALLPFMKHGVVINEGKPNEERGFIDVERCGHSFGVPCRKLARWEVGIGRVL